MQKPEEVQRVIGQWTANLWALATLSTVVETGALIGDGPQPAATIAERIGAPAHLVEALCELLVSHGLVAREGGGFVATSGLQPLLAGESLKWDLRTQLAQASSMIAEARQGRPSVGWRFTDPDVLQAQAVFSENMLGILRRFVFPPELIEQLSRPGAAILDVGAGGGGHLLAFARGFPQLRCVGLEPAPAPLAVAKANVERAGLAERIELRAQRIEELDDESAFDFAWLPQMFLPDEVLAQGLSTTFRALKPRGWFVTASMVLTDDSPRAALSRLRDVLYGGRTRTQATLAAQLAAAGFVEVTQMAPMGDGTSAGVIARKP